MKIPKPLPLFPLLLLSFFLASIPDSKAQAYHPFPAGRSLEYSFTQTGSSETWFLAADFDSVRAEGVDTIFYFYRIDRELLPSDSDTTCWGQQIQFMSPLILVNKDHYLGQKMAYAADGACKFISSEGDTFLLQTRLGVGNAWTWATGVTATVDSVVWGMVIGVPDSLKYIGLSTGETWILSKSHGLVECTNLLPFPGVSGNPITIHLSISAIPTLGLGHALPGYAEVFQFDPGDKFGIESHQFNHPGWHTIDWEYHVQSLMPGTRFHYQTTREEFDLTNPGQGASTTNYYPPAAYSWFFDSVGYTFVELKPYQTHPYNPFISCISQAGVHAGASMNGRILKEYLLTAMYDSCAQVVTGAPTSGNQTFGEGIGEVYYYWGNVQTMQSRTLYCYAKGTESWGTCIDLSSLGTEEPSMPASLSVYPNPAQTMVRIKVGIETKGIEKRIRLIHLDGREVGSATMAANDLTFDLPLDGLPAGMYLVEVDAKGFQIHRERLVIAH